MTSLDYYKIEELLTDEERAIRDRAAQFVSALYFMRNAERQAGLFQQRVLPAAEQALSSSRQAYAAGTVGFADLIDSQRTLLQVRLMIAEAKIERELRLAELEALAGVDVETLARPATAPSTTQAAR
jgi:outer membrane protein TolC